MLPSRRPFQLPGAKSEIERPFLLNPSAFATTESKPPDHTWPCDDAHKDASRTLALMIEREFINEKWTDVLHPYHRSHRNDGRGSIRSSGLSHQNPAQHRIVESVR